MENKGLFGKALGEIGEFIVTVFTSVVLGKGMAEKNSAGEGTPTEQRRRGIFAPKFDEKTFLTLSVALEAEERRGIDFLMKALGEPKESELVKQFRELVTDSPTPVEKQEPYTEKDRGGKDVKKTRTVKIEFTKEDARVKYLALLGGQINGPEAAGQFKQHMLDSGLIVLDPWQSKLKGWGKKNLCQFFGVKTIDEITERMLAQKLNDATVAVKNYRTSRRSRFKLFENKLAGFSTVVFVIGVVVATITVATR